MVFSLFDGACMDITVDGWLNDVECCPSPNADARLDIHDISLLVIHNISLPPGQFGSGCVEQFFCNKLDHDLHPFFDEIRDLKVSAHVLIERTGRIVQFVPFIARAWHAGVSSFEGRDCCNDFSIGIELEGEDHSEYTQEQYRMLTKVTIALLKEYPHLHQHRIVGHNDIAPDRKTDPGPAFDWLHYRQLMSAEVVSPPNP